MTGEPKPDPQAFVLAEYAYLASAAFHNNEERARASQLFFVTFLTLVAAVYSSQLEDARLDLVYRAFAALFAVLYGFGALTILQLARFRLAWLDAAAAMNAIKEQAIQEHPELAAYYRWRKLPAAFNPRSVGFLVAVSVAILSGVAAGAVVAFWRLAAAPEAASVPWRLSLGVGMGGAALALAVCYWWPLRR